MSLSPTWKTRTPAAVKKHYGNWPIFMKELIRINYSILRHFSNELRIEVSLKDAIMEL